MIPLKKVAFVFFSLKMGFFLGMVLLAYHPSVWDVQAGGLLQIPEQPKIYKKALSKNLFLNFAYVYTDL